MQQPMIPKSPSWTYNAAAYDTKSPSWTYNAATYDTKISKLDI